jgi:hypothetical protein
LVIKLVHARTEDAPESISLEMLAKIAIIGDYYKCHKAVQFFVRAWKALFFETWHCHCDPGLVLRLVIASVFADTKIFWLLTHITITRSTSTIFDLDVPPLACLTGEHYGVPRFYLWLTQQIAPLEKAREMQSETSSLEFITFTRIC